METKRLKVENVVSADYEDMDDISIDILDDHSLIRIFKYVPLLKKVKIERVCKKWNNLIKLTYYDCIKSVEIDERIKFENFSLNGTSTYWVEFFVEVLKKFGPYVSKISINSEKLRKLRPLLTKIGKLCNNLTEIYLIDRLDMSRGFTDVNLECMFVNNRNLKVLSLTYLNLKGDCLFKLPMGSIEELCIIECKITPRNDLIEFFAQLKNLKKFHINHGAFDSDDSIVRNAMEGFKISNNEKFSEFTLKLSASHSVFLCNLKNIILKQKNLKNLNLFNVNVNTFFINSVIPDSIEELALRAIRIEENALYSVNRFKNLKSFTCSISTLSDRLVQTIADCLNLIELDLQISNKISLTSDGLKNFSKMKNLESIRIYNTSFDKKVDDILTALESCQKIKTINIYECDLTENTFKILPRFLNLMNLNIIRTTITNEQLADLILKSKNLQEIHIPGCKNLTSDVIKEISKIKDNRKDKHILKINHSFRNIDPYFLDFEFLHQWDPSDVSPLVLLEKNKYY